MKLTKNERLVLNDLSLKVYGTKSKWHKMVNKPHAAKQSETLEDGTKREFIGMNTYYVDEIKTTMEELWVEEQERIAKEEVEKKVEVTNE